MAASSSNATGDNLRPPPLPPPQVASSVSPPSQCQSCRSSPGIPFCRVEWSFLCSRCAPSVHSNSWIVAVNPNPSSPYPYPYPRPSFTNPNPTPSPNPSLTRYREKKRSRKLDKAAHVESRTKVEGPGSAGTGAGSSGGSREGGAAAV